MSVSSFEILPDDILYEIFSYLSSVDILQSFLLSKRLSRVIINEYLWHIHIGDSTMSLLMFSDYCNNVLKLIGGRVVSLRLTFTNVIGGWSLISSSLRYHQTTLLQRLHLIDIKSHEFDKLLRNQLIKQLHTLLVDVTPSNPFHCFQVEGIYLVTVCSRMPLLKIYRLPFNHNDGNVNQIENYSLKYQMTTKFIKLPAPIDAHLQYLSRLRIHCLNNISFHRTIALLSSVLSQICHLSLKLEVCTLISSSFIISGDIIQQLCIDRLKPMATYSLNLLLYVEHDLEEKRIFNSFCKVPFTHRRRPRVFIQEYNDSDMSHTYHCFMVYIFPYNDTILSSYTFSTNLEKFCQKPTDVTDLFPRANTLSLYGYKKTNCVRDLGNSRSSISSLVPWLLLTHININHSDVITQHTLVSILRMAYNVHTLEIFDDRGILLRTILHNKDKFGTPINQQIKSLDIFDIMWTLQNAQRFCTLLSNQFHNLRSFSFTIFDSYRHWQWKPSRITDGKNKSTKRIVNLIYLIVDHLKQLVWLKINFCNLIISNTCCFPHLIRRQLHQYPLSRSCRLQCSTNMIQIWL